MIQLLFVALIALFFKNGSAIMDCTVLFDGCVNDTTCWNTVGNTYYDACSPLWDTNYTYNYCPTNCSEALFNYLTYFDPNHNSTLLTFCDCNTTSNSNCESVRQQIIDVGCIEQDCRDVVSECQLNSTCNATFMNYFEACQEIINGTWSSMGYDFCPTGCMEALQEFVDYVAPNYTTISFCGCTGNTDCQSVKDDLEKYGCAIPSCTDVFNDCQADPICQPIAQAYYDSCNVIFNNSWTYGWCPSDCETNLLAYLNYTSPNLTEYASYCECDGSSKTECNNVKTELYDLGCIGDSCVHMFYDCTLDPSCNSTAINYLNACEEVLSGTWTYNWCPSQCTYWLWQYIHAIAPNATTTDFCDCYTNEGCEEKKNYLLNANCVNTDCTQLLVECENDPTCAPYATNFKSKCGSILDGTYNGESCPTGCSEAISDYINATNNDIINDQYCDCNGNSTCITYLQTLYNDGCVVSDCSQIFYDCVNTTSNCSVVALNYFDKCQAIINGSWTTAGECPDGCSTALRTYIQEVWGVTTLDLDQYCDCNYDTECTSVKAQLELSGCYTPSTTSSDSPNHFYTMSLFIIYMSLFVASIMLL